MNFAPPSLEPKTLVVPAALGLFAGFTLWALTCGALTNPLAAMALGAVGGAVGAYATQTLRVWAERDTDPTR